MAMEPIDEKAVFNIARRLIEPDERAAYLQQVCGHNSEALRRILDLLHVYDQSQSFLESPVPALGATIDAPQLGEQPGTVIGPYKLLEMIGEGGMGTVWMAQQTEPVRRLVAVKLIKAGMDSKQVIARFEAERQALALMDHPNIARVLDAGTTDAGRPYFVMELVKGIPITKYCDEHHLTPRQRLELFIPVCQAIQHAHQKGIIHRDIKPSNVLVAMYDDRPVPKVIDFGVAKATGQQLTEATLHTSVGAVVGTIEYMSPEQASFSQLDVDTRSDIYSLGVLLYELLAGSTPFTKKDLEQAGMMEMLRMIREKEPSKPSTKLSSSDALPSLSANRGTEPSRLTRLVRGELDWIVMKALEKDRSRRYETANAFVMDAQRYLADEAVQACPPSAGYRMRKFVQRNKGPVLAAAVVLLTLVGGIVGTTLGLVRAERARQAESERADGEHRARLEVEERAEETRAMLDLVERGILVARLGLPVRLEEPLVPGPDPDAKTMLRQAVEEALPFVDRFKDRPLVEARLRLTLAAAFVSLDEPTLAVQQVETARALYAERRGPDHPDTIAAMYNLAGLYARLGRYPDALNVLGAVLALQKDRRGADHPDTLATMVKLADYHDTLKQPADALKLREEVFSRLMERKAALEPGHLWLIRGGARRGPPFKLEQVLAIQNAKLAPGHPETLATMMKLVEHYRYDKRHADALNFCREVLAIRTAKLGPADDLTLNSMWALSSIHTDLEQYEEALKLVKQFLAIKKVKSGPHHDGTVSAMWDLVSLHTYLKQHEEAVMVMEELLAIEKVKAGPAHDSTLRTMEGLAGRYDALGRPKEALKLRVELINLWKAKFTVDHFVTQRFMNVVADYYTTLGQHADALKLREEVLTIRKAKLPADPLGATGSRNVYDDLIEMLKSMNGVADSYAALGRHAEAQAHYGQSLELYKGLITKYPREPQYFRYWAGVTAAKLGAVQLLGTRKVEEAEARFAEAVRLGEHADVYFTIGAAYARDGQWKKAAPAYNRGVAMHPFDHTRWYQAAALYLGAGDVEGYRRACREMIDRFCTGRDVDPMIAERTAKACSLTPGAVADFGQVEKLAQRAVTGTETHASYRFFAWAKGLAEYRAGRHAEAVKWLERFAPDAGGASHDAAVFAALAMAKHRQGQTNEAKTALAKAKAIMLEKMPNPSEGRLFGPTDWHDWLHAQLLGREAEETLKNEVGAKKPESKTKLD